MSEGFVIYHNPRCRKSRESLALLEEQGIKPEVKRYLENPPSREELKLLLAKLDLKVDDIIRKEEKIYKERFRNCTFTEDEWLDVLIEEPKLIQRPIVVHGARARIGRPPENVLNLLK